MGGRRKARCLGRVGVRLRGGGGGRAGGFGFWHGAEAVMDFLSVVDFLCVVSQGKWEFISERGIF